MFRFSIRELMLVTLVVAIVISWFFDHQWALVKIEEARSNADFWETKYSEDEAQLRKQLAGYGLEWSYNVPFPRQVCREFQIDPLPLILGVRSWQTYDGSCRRQNFIEAAG